MSITLDRLTKTFPGGVTALRDFSLNVNAHELLVVLGPSGCGKTTLLRLIAGLEQPTSGAITIAGRPADRLKPAQRNLGFVFQQPVLYPHMTVEENLGFVLRRERITAAEKQHRIGEIVELCRIKHLIRRKPGEISVGEQQRVSLARHVLRKPACLLLDEPLASLDAPLRAELRREIRTIHEHQRLTSIFVTHDQQEAFALADRVALVRQGELQQLAAPMALYRNPANAFAATFIGSPGMNLVHGRVEREGGATRFSAGAALRLPIDPRMAAEVREEIVLGIRPEDIALGASDAAGDESVSFEVKVARSEALGDHAILHVNTRDGRPLVIKTGRDADAKAGELLRARLAFSACHYFEPGPDGRRLGGA